MEVITIELQAFKELSTKINTIVKFVASIVLSCNVHLHEMSHQITLSETLKDKYLFSS